MAQAFRPLRDRVLIRREEAETKSPGGIIIPDNVKERPTVGVVIAVGPGYVTPHGTWIEMRVKAGDRVAFGKYSGSEIELAGVPHIVLGEGDLLGVLEDSTAKT